MTGRKQLIIIILAGIASALLSLLGNKMFIALSPSPRGGFFFDLSILVYVIALLKAFVLGCAAGALAFPIRSRIHLALACAAIGLLSAPGAVLDIRTFLSGSADARADMLYQAIDFLCLGIGILVTVGILSSVAIQNFLPVDDEQ